MFTFSGYLPSKTDPTAQYGGRTLVRVVPLWEEELCTYANDIRTGLTANAVSG